MAATIKYHDDGRDDDFGCVLSIESDIKSGIDFNAGFHATAYGSSKEAVRQTLIEGLMLLIQELSTGATSIIQGE